MKAPRFSRWNRWPVWLAALFIVLIAGLGWYGLSDEELKPVDHLAPRRKPAPATAASGWGRLGAARVFREVAAIAFS